MANYIGNKFGKDDHDKLADFEKRVNPNDKAQTDLLEEMRAHVKKLEELRKNEDPRLSFATPEFKEAQRMFTERFKKNFDRPVEWGMIKDYPWSTPQLRKLEVPLTVDGKPWPLDASGKPILKT
ncbi:hypothetical protein CVIRNUC_000333 [Coccomyxa viridis]|uniref:ATP synthase subunit d, mitochondrial n=1 Tax=Coccomyxa viridis TaxID=1274662 RepID=A0AAV1HTX9_9CHLO|nr:hypothetical protein CVIRNUC_000333 [Coccomyxa viridis]